MIVKTGVPVGEPNPSVDSVTALPEAFVIVYGMLTAPQVLDCPEVTLTYKIVGGVSKSKRTGRSLVAFDQTLLLKPVGRVVPLDGDVEVTEV